MKKCLRKAIGPEAGNCVVEDLRGELRKGLLRVVVEAGMTEVMRILDEEVTSLCGPRYRHGDKAEPKRWGKQRGAMVLGGRKIRMQRPRVRQGGQELELPSYVQFRDEDPLDERALEQMLIGVSTRKYGRSLEKVHCVEGYGSSKSAVSRRFVAMTEEQLVTLLGTRLDVEEWVAVMVDGLGFGDHTIVVALGIDATGKKHILGLREGRTENATLCKELLTSLVARGFPQDRHLLFVVDGGKGLRRAIREVFGDKGVVQRCQVHKQRNVQEHLPDEKKGQVRAVMQQAYRTSSSEAAKKQLLNLARSLEDSHPGAAASLQEGLEETLTVKKLGLTGRLERTMSTTNPIENINGTVRYVSSRVKRCRGGKMALRWVGASLIEAAKGFRRIRGCKEIPVLLAALRNLDKKVIESLRKVG